MTGMGGFHGEKKVLMTVGAKESEPMGKVDLVFDLSCRTVSHVKEAEILGFRLTGTPFHDV